VAGRPGRTASERWLRALAEPLMQALAVLHGHDTVHRDVAPDNLLMLYDHAKGNYLEQAPRPVLLDFGAARRVAAEATQNLTRHSQDGLLAGGAVRQRAIPHAPGPVDQRVCAVRRAVHGGHRRGAARMVARLVRDDLVPAPHSRQGPLFAGLPRRHRRRAGCAPENRPQTMAELAWFARPIPPAAAPKPAADLELPLDAPAARADDQRLARKGARPFAGPPQLSRCGAVSRPFPPRQPARPWGHAVAARFSVPGARPSPGAVPGAPEQGPLACLQVVPSRFLEGLRAATALCQAFPRCSGWRRRWKNCCPGRATSDQPPLLTPLATWPAGTWAEAFSMWPVWCATSIYLLNLNIILIL